MKFIITVDVEADNQWQDAPLQTVENVFGLPRFHDLAKTYGFKPTYLLTYEVANDERAVVMLKTWQDQGEAEIGAHFHPWTTPPQIAEDRFKRFPSELSDKELDEKLALLTDLIRKKFGRRPKSYRAGRFGFDGRQVTILERLGYLVDCSITPKVSWQKAGVSNPGESGPDWRSASVFPYHISAENLLSEDKSGKGLLEIPVTILATGLLAREGKLNQLFAKLPNNILFRIIKKLFYRMKWLRIFPETTAADWQAILKSAEKNNLPVLEFMIHSSELTVGASPYAKTPEAVEKIYANLKALFELLKLKNVAGATLSEYAAIAR